jgi:transmembrane sensor
MSSSQFSHSDSTIDAAVLDRVLAGDASPDEQASVARWALEHPEREALRSVLGTLAVGGSETDGVLDTDAAWRQWREAMVEPLPAASQPRKTVSRQTVGPTHPWRRRMVSLAAVGGGVALAVVLMNESSINDMRGVRAASANDGVAITYTTTIGQQATINLTDGSRVTLAPDSRLEVARDFGAHRAISLRGEAYFHVVPNRVPFVVRTGAVTTRVLGTTFDVRAYKDDRTVQVTVVDGRVVTVLRNDARILTARMVAHVSDSAVTVARVDDTTPFTAWLDGRLTFQGAPAGEVLAAVTRWYGVTFRDVAPGIARARLTTTLDTRRSRSEVIAVLESILDVRVTAVGDTLTLTPRTGTGEPRRVRQDTEGFTLTKEMGR